jgi:hypothetical protein
MSSVKVAVCTHMKVADVECVARALQVIELPLKHPELFESLGIAQPKVGPQQHAAGSIFIRACRAAGAAA